MSVITVAIIGTADRDGTFTEEFLQKLQVTADKVITEDWKLDRKEVALVSGGSTGVDHVAVRLFDQEKYGQLHLHLPASFDIKSERYEDNGKFSYQENPGKLLNNYHHKFLQGRALSEIAAVSKDKRVTIEISNGKNSMWQRNNKIAQADYLIAFTAGKDTPSSKGTKYTWDRCKKQKIHICWEDIINNSQ